MLQRVATAVYVIAETSNHTAGRELGEVFEEE